MLGSATANDRESCVYQRGGGYPQRLSGGAARVISVRLLGAIAAEVDGQSIDLGGLRQRSLFCLLVLNRNHVLTADALADRLWPNDQPMTSIKTVQVYVSRVRALLGPEAPRLESVAGGYRLRLDDAELDSARFEADLNRARALLAQGDAGNARRALEQALALWQGAALADIANEPFALLEAERLEELRWRAREDLLEARIADGESGQVVAEIRRAVRDHPEREGLWGQLIRALYAEGRQGEALAAFREARDYLSEELGIDPSPALQALEGAVLRQELAVPAVNRANASASATIQPTVGDVGSTSVDVYDQPIARLGPRRISDRHAVAKRRPGTTAVIATGGATAITLASLFLVGLLGGIGGDGRLGAAASGSATPSTSTRVTASLSPTNGPALLPSASVQALDIQDDQPVALLPGRYTPASFQLATEFQIVRPGWMLDREYADGFSLFQRENVDAPVVGYLGAAFVQVVLDSPCLDAKTHALPRDPTALIDWLETNAWLSVSNPEPVNLAGYSGLRVDVSQAKSPKGTCDYSGIPEPEQGEIATQVYIFVFGEDNFHVDVGEKLRLLVLDVAGKPVTLLVGVPDATNFDSFLEGVQPILDSLKFSP
jgi:DNA-binding SARP family transcriptional activator